jgi:hypothetical protein
LPPDTAPLTASQLEQDNIKAVRNYSEAFRNRNVIILCLQYFAWSIGV